MNYTIMNCTEYAYAANNIIGNIIILAITILPYIAIAAAIGIGIYIAVRLANKHKRKDKE